MARIPEEAIERIKRETDLAALVRSRGIELRKHGNGHLIGPCPFHDENDPSFIVTPAKGLFHCMGCGAAGNVIQFVQKFDGISFRHAYEVLASGSSAAYTPLKVNGTPGKKSDLCNLENPLSCDADDYELMAEVVEYYHRRLLDPVTGENARDYLQKRGLNDEKLIRTFKIGYADRTLGLRIPRKSRLEGKKLRDKLQELGLFREKSGHEHFNGSIVLPVFDEHDCVAEMYGRKITRGLRKGTPDHLYLPGPHAGIWNREALESGELILCEAPLDALTFWVNGIRNVTFIYGTEGFPDYFFEALITHRIKTVRLAYDNDNAGNRAAVRDVERLTSHGIETFRIRFPWNMDVNEYAQKVTPAAKSLATVVSAAEWMGGKVNAPGSAHTRVPARSSIAAIPLAADLSCEALAKQEAANKIAALPSPAESGREEASPETGAGGEAAEEKTARPDTAEPVSDIPLLERLGDPGDNAGGCHTLTLGQRHYRIGGLDKNNSLDVLKVSLRIRCRDNFHLDSIDMTRDADRRRFIERAAEETRLEKELIKRDLGRLLLAMESAQQSRLETVMKPAGEGPVAMSADERTEALGFLKSPDLVGRIQQIFEDCGLVGESTNRLAAYLACTSRKLARPLAVIIQSTSAAGKSTLMEAVLAMFPEEERIKYSAMTGQSLYYLGETDLRHRILAIVEEEGAEKASYALKLLQSEGELTIASTGKDPHTGRMETQEYHVEGPVMIFLTTTAIEIDEELLNRCLVLTVDESKEQTERIHALQRRARTLEGLRRRKHREQQLTLMRNVQRLLEPVDVVNPYADQLTFTAGRTRTRRDHEKYLTLIDAIALLHQHQRERHQLSGSGSEPSQYITVIPGDIELANRIAPELLGRSLDELPPQTRRVYEVVRQIVKEHIETRQVEQRIALFNRREVRARLGWSVTQVRAHLERLRDMEYITVRYGRPGSAFQYELLADCSKPDDADCIELLDVAQLRVAAKSRAGRGGDVRLRHKPSVAEAVEDKPVGEKGNLSAGCRPPDRQVQPPEESELTPNLSACSECTSGTAREKVS